MDAVEDAASSEKFPMALKSGSLSLVTVTVSNVALEVRLTVPGVVLWLICVNEEVALLSELNVNVALDENETLPKLAISLERSLSEVVSAVAAAYQLLDGALVEVVKPEFDRAFRKSMMP